MTSKLSADSNLETSETVLFPNDSEICLLYCVISIIYIYYVFKYIL